MRTRKRFLLLHGLIFLLGLNSCSINKKEKEIPQNQITANDSTGESRCEQIFKRIQVELFNANPISSGADSLIAYLEKAPSFIRNKKYDHGNGSVRFNAKDAEVYGYNLIDEKSLFLINYTLAGPQKNKVFLFQAIYYFENKEDQLELTQRMKKFLSEAKGVKKKHFARYSWESV